MAGEREVGRGMPWRLPARAGRGQGQDCEAKE